MALYTDEKWLSFSQRDARKDEKDIRAYKIFRKRIGYLVVGCAGLTLISLLVANLSESQLWFIVSAILSLALIVALGFYVYAIRQIWITQRTLKTAQKYIQKYGGKVRSKEEQLAAARQAVLAKYKPELEKINYDMSLLSGLIAGGIAAAALEKEIKRVLKYANAFVLGERETSPLNEDDDSTVTASQASRDRHTYIIGKSGSGKTTLLLNMIYQDLQAGNGLGVIAPEQEMITEQILPFIPEDRLDDVIYFNPADENPVPFNPLNLEAGEDAGLKANEVMTIFQRVIGAESTPRIGQILYQAFHALLMTPNTTLLDIRKLLNRDNPEFRQQIISQIKDEECIEFWRDDYPQYPKEAHLPILYRVSPFTRDKRVRNTLCQTGQNLNFRQVMDSGKIILFNLSDGILGEATSQLFGQLIVSQIQQAAISRANIPEQERRRFYLYIDEFQTFTNTATSSYEKILSRARKYKLALILAHQQTGQIPRELLMDIFGNVSTMICFMISHNDATKFSKEFIVHGQPLPPGQFIDLEVGETFCKLGKESFKMKTPLVTQKPNWDIKEKIIEQSRQQFTSDTPTPTTSSQPKPPDQPEQPAPDEPLFTKPKIKPTGKIK